MDLIDYEDGYVAPNMSYVPEGLDEHEVGSGGGAKVRLKFVLGLKYVP